MSAITLRDVGKSYGNTEVLRGVNVDIEKGEFVALVGSSGCGKSTLLRMIAGLEEISAGEISVGGRVVNDLSPKDRDIAMVFQNYALYPHMTVLENMGFSLKLAGRSKSEMRAAVAPAAEILGLAAYLDRFPRQLSGGQRQRVAMGRAIVRKPTAFLFDEPLSNLDAKLRVAMRTEIKALHQRLGTTIVYVTHDQIEAMTLADRIVVLNGGRVEQVGAPLELYDAPRNRFVAEFIGSPSMNMIPAKLQASALSFADGISLNGSWTDDAPRDVTVGIRPDRFQLSSGEMGLPITIEVVEPTGSETMVHGALAGTPVTLVLQGRPVLHAGTMTRFTVAQEALYFFDNNTGNRLDLMEASQEQNKTELTHA